jgi:hypothetical protein
MNTGMYERIEVKRQASLTSFYTHVGSKLWVLVVLPLEKNPFTYCTDGSVGSRGTSVVYCKVNKEFLPVSGIEFRFLDRPAFGLDAPSSDLFKFCSLFGCATLRQNQRPTVVENKTMRRTSGPKRNETG